MRSESTRIGEEEINQLLFMDNMTVYVEFPHKSIDKP